MALVFLTACHVPSGQTHRGGAGYEQDCELDQGQPDAGFDARVNTEPCNDMARFCLMRCDYYRAVEGDREAADKAMALLRELKAAHADDPLVMVYHGSLLLLRAGRSASLDEKVEFTREGLMEMERAVEAAPQVVEVRFVRGMTSVNLPGILGRRKVGEEDVAWVADRAVKAVESGELQPEMAAAALTLDGKRLMKIGERDAALKRWRGAILLAPESRSGRDAAQLVDAVATNPEK